VHQAENVDVEHALYTRKIKAQVSLESLATKGREKTRRRRRGRRTEFSVVDVANLLSSEDEAGLERESMGQ
jgi:hypothetical protein